MQVDCDELRHVIRRTSLHGKALTVLMGRKESFYRKYQAQVYNFLERPKTNSAMAYHFIVFTSVFACLITSILSTVEEVMELAAQALVYMELVMLFWFFIEYIVRMWSAGCRQRYQTWRGRLRFARRPFCVVDVILIVASIVVLAGDNDNNVFAASALRGLRFFQILRMIRVDRRAGSFKLLASVVWSHRQELFTTMYIGFLGLIFSSFLVYLVEKKHNKKIKSYADALWWGVITLCTVGYGDTVPQTWMGKVIAAFCAVAGISFFALPAGILGSGLALKVQQHQRQKHLIRRRIPAATLIQCFWRCYAADKKSTSKATWSIYRKCPWHANHNLNSSGSFNDRPSLVRFGQRLSSIKRKAERLKLHSSTSGRNPLQPNVNFIQVLGMGTISNNLEEAANIHETGIYNPTEFETDLVIKEICPLRKTRSDYKIDEGHMKYPDFSLKDVQITSEENGTAFNLDLNEGLDYLLDRSDSTKNYDYAQPDSASTSVSPPLPFVQKGALAYSGDSRHLTEDDKTVIRTMRKIMFFVARRKFREALRPYDVKDVIEQYSAGHVDMMSRIKILQSRLDSILGRQGGKVSTAYNSHISLASRILTIESNMKKMDKKIDLVLQLCTNMTISHNSNVAHILEVPATQSRSQNDIYLTSLSSKMHHRVVHRSNDFVLQTPPKCRQTSISCEEVDSTHFRNVAVHTNKPDNKIATCSSDEILLKKKFEDSSPIHVD